MKLYKIIFSPTGGTSKVADSITAKWNDAETIDLSDKTFDFNIELEKGSLALVAVPSFGGLAPQLALDRLACIKATDCKCVVAAVYGNRAYDDTLLQMKDCAEKSGFIVIAAVSAVAEHSIIRAYASQRPDANDCDQLVDFGNKIIEKAETSSKSVNAPGNRPYKKAGGGMVPKVSSNCTKCGLCAKLCPAGAIDLSNPKVVYKTKCIGCMRCVSVCPTKARSINPLMVKIAALAIKKSCSVPKANELFI